MLRDSIPPAFGMAYRPKKCVAFGPPRWSWILPIVYLAVAVGIALTIELSRFAPQSSWAWQYFVAQDVDRLISARTFALLLLAGAMAALLRTSMQGVFIHPEGIEARGLIVFGWPRIRKCDWVEIDRMTMDGEALGIHLWNGSSLWLPSVADRNGLFVEIERVAQLRSIPFLRRERPALVRLAV